MVQNENPVPETTVDPPTTVVLENPAKGIPNGNYRLVGWGIDATGSRLIDEVIQIASYVPDSQFSQYIMPYADINPIFSYRHGIRVVNTMRYRRLKDSSTNEYVKTKSEISALQDYLQWLETVKGDCDGVVLVYYEIRKTSPALFLESLKRNNLLERFAKVVKGFANGLNVVQAKCANITKSFSLRVMAKVLLNREKENFGSAAERAKASFDIVAHLAQGEREDLGEKPSDSTGIEPHVVEFVCPYANSIEVEEEEVETFKVLLKRQNTFRPVFGALLKSTRQERQHASHLRRLLAENNINYNKLEQAYESSAKEGLENIIKNEISNAKEEDLVELLNILDCFFDPGKQPVQPKRFTSNYAPGYKKRNKSFNRKKSGGGGGEEGGAQSDSTSTPRSDGGIEKTQEEEIVPAVAGGGGVATPVAE